MIKNIIFKYTLLLFIFPITIYAEQQTSAPTINWTAFQGNAQHNSYVPITLDPNLFKFKWKTTFSLDNAALWQRPGIVTTDNQVYLMTSPPPSPDGFGFNIYALDSNAGNIVWQKSYNQFTTYPNNLVIDNNKLFFTTSDRNNNNQTSNLVAMNTDGSVIYNTIINSDAVAAPAITQNKICFNSSLGSVSCYDENSGQSLWQTYGTSGNTVVPAIANNLMAVYGDSSLNFYNINDGSLVNSVSIDYLKYYTPTPILIDNNMQYAITVENQYPGKTTVTNIQNAKIQYTINNTSSNNIAIANNNIYALKYDTNANSSVQIYDLASGKPTWSTNISNNAAPFSYPIVTKNLLFVSTGNYINNKPQSTTYAVDLKTHQIVWKYSGASVLALTSNTLYLQGDDNSLVAISLN